MEIDSAGQGAHGKFKESASLAPAKKDKTDFDRIDERERTPEPDDDFCVEDVEMEKKKVTARDWNEENNADKVGQKKTMNEPENGEARGEGAETIPAKVLLPREKVKLHAMKMRELHEAMKRGEMSGVPGKDCHVDLIAKAFVKLGKTVERKADDGEIEEARDGLEREILKYEQDVVRKMKQQKRMFTREGDSYEQEVEEYRERLIEVERIVDEMKQKVRLSNIDKKSEQRKETLRKEIEELPEKEISIKILAEIEEDIERLELKKKIGTKETNIALEALDKALSSISQLPGDDDDGDESILAATGTTVNQATIDQATISNNRTIISKVDTNDKKLAKTKECEDMVLDIQDAAEDGEIV